MTPRSWSSPAYSEPGRERLCRAFSLIVAAVTLASVLGGCSYQLGALGSQGTSEAPERTSSIPSTARAVWPPIEADLAVAKAAVVELFTRGSQDAGQPWENPLTGARGTITPVASAYTQDGTLCRDFLASYLRNEKESWFQGGACRIGSKWEVRDIRPLNRS